MCYTFEIILQDKFFVDMITTKQKTLETRKETYEDSSFGVTLKDISVKTWGFNYGCKKDM